jgi:hypothetical protein
LIDLGTLAVDEWTLAGLSSEWMMDDGKRKGNKGVKLVGKKLAGACPYQVAAAQLRQYWPWASSFQSVRGPADRRSILSDRDSDHCRR